MNNDKEKYEMTWFEKYCKEIEDKNLIIGKSEKEQIKNIKEILANPNYYYDTTEAEEIISFIENNCIELLLWQKAFTELIYSLKNKATGKRVFYDLRIKDF